MKKIVFAFFLFSLLHGLDTNQLRVIKTVYNTCKNIKAYDGFSFENTCAAIVLTESSAGKNIIGDQFEYPDILVSSSLGVMQVRVRTVLEVLKKYPKLRSRYHYMWHYDIDAIKNYVPLLYKIKVFRLKLQEARQQRNWKLVKKYRKLIWRTKKQFQKYKKAYKKDLLIAETLLADIKFNATIAAHYLVLNYETAKRKHMWNPWLKAVSRYNGGWFNDTYIKRVMKNMKVVRKLKREGKL